MSEVQGDSRVSRYRHLLYDWLGVEKFELAVMGVLLFAWCPRPKAICAPVPCGMDPIPDLTTLRNLVSALKSRGLIVGLTPEGRGHVCGPHVLYQPGEMEKLRAEYRGGAQADRPSSEAAVVPRGIASPVASPAAVHVPADRRPQTVASPATAASDRTASDRAVNELARHRRHAAIGS